MSCIIDGGSSNRIWFVYDELKMLPMWWVYLKGSKNKAKISFPNHARATDIHDTIKYALMQTNSYIKTQTRKKSCSLTFLQLCIIFKFIWEWFKIAAVYP